MTEADRDRVIAEAITWIGTPYHVNAAVKGAGADCALMPLAVYRAALPTLPQIALPKYLPQWHLHQREEIFLEWVRKFGCKPVDAPTRAGFVVFRFGHIYSHGAIVTTWPQIIHSVKPTGVVYADVASETRLARQPRLFFDL